ncbi:MAG: alpha/beta hydrolase [Desulfobacteraceae bacterium]|jgi:pimeloyl-ACP methyl ester carboxylesterase|nr:alpha/beta hydrolase [Desulfobacteraceae bacterium]
MPQHFTPDGLCYEVHGPDDAPAVVFLNGTGQTVLYWQNAARRLRRRYRVVLYDARGQGQSPLNGRRLDLQGHVEDLVGLLDLLRVPRAHLVGLSHGAYVAAALAAGHRQRVDGLVLSGVGDAPATQGIQVLQRWRRILEEEGLGAMARRMLPDVFGPRFRAANAGLHEGMARAIVRRNDAVALAAQLEAVLDYRPLAEIAMPGLPCLVISGGQDALVPPEAAERLAGLYGGRHVCLPEAGHSVPVEAGEVFLTLVESFLSQQQRPSQLPP